ncbi:hypothetical protein [Pseudomonas sp. ICMP 561]|uniref:hypothetical protein n=1 Tax=Pseudomonas sp. ICMP 561 TaxID=1718918 RepID=UPI000C08BE23|nr:hypothetical protein [Pseudomonas sp. ICMP 561]PHN33328.1 hypothetical protein AO242_21755 [Pseudomonas sp. ICMP 561]
MGRLIQDLQNAGQPTDEIKAVLTNVLVQRSWLAHKYFSEKSVSFMTESGRSEMIAELEAIQEMFRNSMAMIGAITMPITCGCGLTEEMHKRVMQELMAS